MLIRLDLCASINFYHQHSELNVSDAAENGLSETEKMGPLTSKSAGPEPWPFSYEVCQSVARPTMLHWISN